MSKFPPLPVSEALVRLFSEEESARLRSSTAHKGLFDYTQEEFIWLLSRYEIGDIAESKTEAEELFKHFNFVTGQERV